MTSKAHETDEKTAKAMGTADDATIEALRQDVAELKDALSTVRTDLGTLARDAVSAGKHSAARATHEVKEMARTAARTTSDKGREVADSIDTTVHDHPYKSCAVSFLAGLALAALVVGRRH